MLKCCVLSFGFDEKLQFSQYIHVTIHSLGKFSIYYYMYGECNAASIECCTRQLGHHNGREIAHSHISF